MEKTNGFPTDGNHRNVAITIPMVTTPDDFFLAALPTSVPVIVADDSNGKLNLDKKRFDVYDYERQSGVLGEFYKEFENFHHSSACRNFAHYLAYKSGFEAIVALDYDCHVPQNFLADHLAALDKKDILGVASNNEWVNPLLSADWYSRGFPYEFRSPEYRFEFKKVENSRVVLNMGLWDNIVDINGIDKVLELPPQKIRIEKDYLVALGNLPICGMNNIFLREAIPAYFFLPNFKIGNWVVSRHDDIWGGYIFKKLADKKGDCVSFGKPVVYHSRESNQPKVLYYEHYMHLLNRYFYDLVDRAAEKTGKSDYKTMFADFVGQFGKLLSEDKSLPRVYVDGFRYLHKSMVWWTNLFEKL